MAKHVTACVLRVCECVFRNLSYDPCEDLLCHCPFTRLCNPKAITQQKVGATLVSTRECLQVLQQEASPLLEAALVRLADVGFKREAMKDLVVEVAFLELLASWGSSGNALLKEGERVTVAHTRDVLVMLKDQGNLIGHVQSSRLAEQWKVSKKPLRDPSGFT
eukprot:2230110-Amphidinium_carterae.1